MPVIFQALLSLPWLIGFAWAAKRLLGAHRLSAFRTFLAGLAGVAVGFVIWPQLVDQGVGQDMATLVSVVLCVASTMATIVLLEVITKPRRVARRAGFPRPIKWATRKWYQVRRSAEITRIAASHGLDSGFGLTKSSDRVRVGNQAGANLRAAMEDAGGLFVKLGQLLANRPDIIPPAVAAELEQLQQDARPVPREKMEPAIEAALGAPLDEIFAEFDWEPLGAASIGQVYSATLHSGEDVVLKVRRPDIQERIDQDLDLVLDLARALEEQVDQAHEFGVSGVADEFAALLRDELDYRIEAKNTKLAREALLDNEVITVPAIFDEYTTDSTLVQERVAGTPLGRLSLNDVENGRRCADELFRYELDAMLSGGIFHADPHPGNVLIGQDQNLTLIDFGSVGRLDAFERSAITNILTALKLQDPAMMRAAALEVGMGGGKVDTDGLDRAFARMMAAHLQDGQTPTPDVLVDFMAIAQEFKLKMPAGVSEMMRAVGTLQGTLEALSPNYPIIEVAEQLAAERFQEAVRPDNLKHMMQQEALRAAPILRSLPYRLDTIVGDVERGQLKLNVSLFSESENQWSVRQIVNMVLTTFIAAVVGLISTMLFDVTGPMLTSNISLMYLLATLGLLLSGTLLMRVLLLVLKHDDER